MWQELTDSAKRALFFAFAEAERLGAEYVGPDHLLLGLTREAESVAVRVLERAGASPRQVRRTLRSRLVASERRPLESLVPGPSLWEVIALARDESQQQGFRHIGPEHLLLGILRQGASEAARALADAGVTLEVARQAIQQYIGGDLALLADLPGSWRLRARARRIVSVARSEAARLRHQRISPEHILLAIAQEKESLAARVLARLGADTGYLLARLAEQMPPGRRAARKLSLDPRTRALFALAEEEARQQDESDIGTEHLLLGLLRQDGEPTAQVLSALGVDLDGARRELQAILSGSPSLLGAIRKKLAASLSHRLDSVGGGPPAGA